MIEDRVLDVLRQHGSMSVREIAGYVNKSTTLVYEMCQRLQHRGFAAYSMIGGVQHWSATHQGFQYRQESA